MVNKKIKKDKPVPRDGPMSSFTPRISISSSYRGYQVQIEPCIGDPPKTYYSNGYSKRNKTGYNLEEVDTYGRGNDLVVFGKAKNSIDAHVGDN